MKPHLVYNKGGFDDLMLRFEISVNTNILVFGFYKYIKNIGGYFDKNIGKTKIIQNSWNCLENIQKNDKISNYTHVKVIL